MATTVNESNFNAEVLSSAVPVLVDFFATWCGPCRMMSPTIDELHTEANGRYAVCKLDVDESSELAQKYNVRSVPTFIAFSGGKETGRTVGAVDKAELLELLGI